MRRLYGFVKGMMIGLTVGGVIGAVAMCCMHHNRRGLKRNVGHALHMVGDLTDSVLGLF